MVEALLGALAAVVLVLLGLMLKRISEIDAKLDRHSEQSPTATQLDERWRGHWKQHDLEREKR